MSTTTEPRTGTKPARLTKWGGWACVLIALAHSLSGILMFSDQWGGILAGELQGDTLMTGNHEAWTAFWMVPGSFALPLVLVGLLAIGRAREGRAMPAYVGWVLLADAIVGGWMIFPSGHIWSLVPVTLFLLDNHRTRKGASA